MDSSSKAAADFRKPLLDQHERVVATATSGDVWENEFDVARQCANEAVNKDGTDEKSTWNEKVILWVILPTMLLSQFGMAFLMHDEETATMSWNIVVCSILLFAMTAWLFRSTCEEVGLGKKVLVLLPELLMNVVLALVFFNRADLGLLVLLVGMLCLSVFVIIFTTIFSYLKLKQRQQKAVDDEQMSLSVCQAESAV